MPVESRTNSALESREPLRLVLEFSLRPQAIWNGAQAAARARLNVFLNPDIVLAYASMIRRVSILLSLVLVSTLFGLALAEGALRAFQLWAIPDYQAMDWYRAVPIPGVPYLLKPHL